MSIVTSSRDNGSTTGVATPATSADGLDDHLGIQEWLRSSGLTSHRPSSNNSRQSVTRMSDPYPGSTFLIVDKSNNRVLGSKGRQLHLKDAGPVGSGESIPENWQWLCTEKDGFKGFKNVAEGGFLGHDIWWDFSTKTNHQLGWENFTLSKREGDYYWIQVLHWWTQWQLSARSDGSGVFAERYGGTLWEFVKVN